MTNINEEPFNYKRDIPNPNKKNFFSSFDSNYPTAKELGVTENEADQLRGFKPVHNSEDQRVGKSMINQWSPTTSTEKWFSNNDNNDNNNSNGAVVAGQKRIELNEDQQDILKNVVHELELTGNLSINAEELAVQKLGLDNAGDLWQLIDQVREYNKKIGNIPDNENTEWGLNVSNNRDNIEEPQKPLVNNPKQFLFGTPIWVISKEIPDKALEWALSLRNTSEKMTHGSVKRGFQSKASTDFNTIPKFILDHIQYSLGSFPRFRFVNWWINISNKGSYNVAHSHPQNDLSVIWYLTDNNESLIFHDPLAHVRDRLYHNVEGSKQGTVNPSAQPGNSFNAKAGDFVIFPSDVVHEVKEHELDTIRLSLSLNLELWDEGR